MGANFGEQRIVFDNGIEGEPLTIESGSPASYFEAISSPKSVTQTEIDAKLFVPQGKGPFPVVIVVPGSLGVAPSHLAHAETATGLGIAACVIDPFGRRQVTSTVANQAQYSFAASAWDVLATAKLLASHPEIDPDRIGAQGHSRGGTAVMTAAMRDFAGAFGHISLAAVYAAYPWCGHQFIVPEIGQTMLRAVIGDRDEWCSPQQVQGHIHAIALTGGNVSFRLFEGAQHSFDRGTEIEMVADASVAPCAPTCYVARDGALIHPLTGEPDPNLGERDVMVYGMKAGYGRRGARIGSEGHQAQQFRADMIAFWREAFART